MSDEIVERAIEAVNERTTNLNLLTGEEMDRIDDEWNIYTTAETLEGCDDSQQWFAITDDGLAEVER